jgi:hypothetical protein
LKNGNPSVTGNLGELLARWAPSSTPPRARPCRRMQYS